MHEYKFEATGTKWAIVLDQDVDPETLRLAETLVRDFEARFSRFIDESEIGKINASDDLEVNREWEISDELAEMLSFGKELELITEGLFDVNVASLLVGHGYDRNYAFVKNAQILQLKRGKWGLRKKEKINIWTEGLVKLDLGAFGKGYLIDKIAKLLNGLRIEYYLIDGGRDFYGTSKADGKAWKIALEHPFDASVAIGEFELKNCALACSGISQRKVKEFHHFMDTKSGMPIAEPVGVFVTASSCMMADGVSTAMAVGHEKLWEKLIEKYGVKGAVVRPSGELINYRLDGFYS